VSSSEAQLGAVARAWGVEHDTWLHRPLGNGHINDTWLVEYRRGDFTRFLVHQRINHHVFRRPDDVMDNISRVLSHLGRRSESGACLVLVARPAAGASGDRFRDADGYTWRAYEHIADSMSFDAVAQSAAGLRVARDAAFAFGRFSRDLSDLPGPRLHDTIPGFHDTAARFARFLEALRADPMNRALMCSDAIEFVSRREADCHRLVDLARRGELPERVAHNDTKLNNILFDGETRRALCVVDLDTVMPGLSAYDFGDLVRTAACSAAEDEVDLARVHVREDVFAALVDGFVAGFGDALTESERAQLAFSGKLIALECGMRFLTDFLEGDRYFKIAHPFHNLVRARAQFALVASIEERMDTLERIVERAGEGE
jgi:hypothetical protein